MKTSNTKGEYWCAGAETEEREHETDQQLDVGRSGGWDRVGWVREQGQFKGGRKIIRSGFQHGETQG
jgi:hypothetical protein